MKKILLLFVGIFAATAASAQSEICSYGGFEELNLSGYMMYTSNYENTNISCPFGTLNRSFQYYTNTVGLNQFSNTFTLVDNDPSVTGGFDPILNSFGADVSRTFSGNYAMKLNNSSTGDHQKSGILKTFSMAETPTVSFRYSIIATNPVGELSIEKPYFLAELFLSDDTILGQLCIEIDESNSIFNKTDTGGILYTGWQCANFTLPEEVIAMGPDIMLQFVVSDGYTGNQFATVYIDDICDQYIEGCSAEKCEYCLYIDTDVTGVDFQKAEHCIEAINTIHNSGSAIYFAGTEVLLKEGFEALSGSADRFYIEQDCTADFEARKAMAQNKDTENEVIKPITGSLQIYPNPSQRELNIVSGDVSLKAVRMISLDGKLVLERRPGADHSKNMKLDVNELSAGIYILTVETADGAVTTHKIVRE